LESESLNVVVASGFARDVPCAKAASCTHLYGKILDDELIRRRVELPVE
jgi:hypothetical protein